LVEQGLAFQAHEVLEAVWKSSSPPARVAWQGMAQLAVALTHAQRGNLVGAARLRERARGNLADGELPAVADALRARLEALIDAAI
jgi:predicted metal-dependent hydrolase